MQLFEIDENLWFYIGRN